MEGYDATSYGRGMADVYDDWYADVTDVGATVARVVALAGGPGGRVLELGVGTGRIALPLAAAGLEVHGVDTSAEMLARLRAKPGAEAVHALEVDMAGAEPSGPFAVVFAAYNTLFNLTSAAAQQACLAAAAARLQPGGYVVVEAFVPGRPGPDADAGAPSAAVEVRDLRADRVVLSVTRTDWSAQTSEGQYVEITEAGGVRLRPWRIRWATPAQLDAMAAAAGLVLTHRTAGWRDEPFDGDSTTHVSVWRHRG